MIESAVTTLLLTALLGADPTAPVETSSGGSGASVPSQAPAPSAAPQASDDASQETCSAKRLPAIPMDRSGLPEKVAALRERLVAAAAACDYEKLEYLASHEGQKTFTFTWGPLAKPADYWRAEERAGHPVMADLVRLLSRPFRRQGRLFVWPSAGSRDATPEDLEALKAVFDSKELASRVVEGNYLGLRTAISVDGKWSYFVGGD